MCLSSITQTDNLPDEMVGYKVVTKDYKSPIWGFQTFSLNEEVIDTYYKYLDTNYHEKYLTGFHVFTTKEEASNFIYGDMINFRMIKVKCKQIVCLGKQSFYNVIVARSITNIGEVE